MIKFASRKNLIYPLQLLIWNVARKILKIIIFKFFNFSRSLIFSFLMFLGEFLFGLIVYLYQKKFLSNKTRESNAKMSKFFIKLQTTENKMKSIDGYIKIYFLMFSVAFFDFIEFILSLTYLPGYIYLSGSLEMRLSGFLTISSALFFYYVLKLPMFKHQFFSLIIIGLCLILVIISELIFQEINALISNLTFLVVLVIIVLIHFFNSLLDSIEKYLFEFDNVNPFEILMYEGLFGIIITVIYCLPQNPINDIIHVYKNNSSANFAIFIVLLVLYTLFCGFRNAFRVITNKIYSPITKTLTDYFVNPIYIIYDFAMGDDFIINGSRNYAYFFINVILSLIITFSGSVYNEFIVLFFCDLEHDTYDQVSKRAKNNEKEGEMLSLFSDEYISKDDESLDYYNTNYQ